MTGHCFDESDLRAAIVAQWGEYGAHVDLFDELVRQRDDAVEQYEVVMAELSAELKGIA